MQTLANVVTYITISWVLHQRWSWLPFAVCRLLIHFPFAHCLLPIGVCLFIFLLPFAFCLFDFYFIFCFNLISVSYWKSKSYSYQSVPIPNRTRFGHFVPVLFLFQCCAKLNFYKLPYLVTLSSTSNQAYQLLPTLFHRLSSLAICWGFLSCRCRNMRG